MAALLVEDALLCVASGELATFCFLSLFFRCLGSRSDASACKFSGLESSRFLSVAILGRGLLVSGRMHRQNRCRELWDLTTAFGKLSGCGCLGCCLAGC